MRIALILFFLITTIAGYSQTNILKGEILDEKGLPLISSTVVLLNPKDSTMQYFGVSGTNGRFEIKGIKNGDYLAQIAFIGYELIYSRITIPYSDNGDMGSIPMTPKPVALDEITVTGERVPLSISRDTVVYNAKAFKIAPGSVVEDLLKKLPGIEVDRAGNIKALGEDVNNVLVDGKEFFGNDPKVATKNLPADALDKVQLFDRKSEEEEFTGIDDGQRNQTINLVLDEDKKGGLFGELMGGYGTGNHYQAKGSIYKFTEKSQVAAIGMINNVNKVGFSIEDYLSFSGGIANISHGEGMKTLGGGSFPINFGEVPTGYSTSGAAGFNYSYSKSKSQRFFISYLGNGSKRDLNEWINTTSYREADSYIQDEYTEQVQRDTSNNINFGARFLFNETNNIILDGNISFNTGYIPLSSELNSYQNDVLVNNMVHNSDDFSDRLSGNVNATYLKRINEGRTVFKINGNAIYSNSNSETLFDNTTNFYNPDSTMIVDQFQDNHIKSARYQGSVSFTQKIYGSVYLDLTLKGGDADESLFREQGDAISEIIIDTLSPEFEKSEQWITPGISIRRNTEKSSLTFGMDYNLGKYGTSLWGDTPTEKDYRYIQPRLNLEYEYKTGRRLMFRYSSRVNTPSVNQLLPVVNNFNSLSLFYGNRDLEPEFIHSLSANWWIFDQFSFTTFFTSLNFSRTDNKINYSRTINDNLGQEVRLENVGSDFTVSGSIDFSTPIRPLGIKTNLSINESLNKGTNIVDGMENEVTNINHRLSLTFDNRKKEKWDIITGAGLTITNASYSIQESLNNIYYDISWFGEINYKPGERFDINITADITNYTAKSFDEAQIVPLIGAQVSYYFMTNNRAAFTLSGFDLLNRNTGIVRESNLNYLRETRSNIIGRYVMISFKYRLNKFGGNKSGIDVKIRKK